MAAGGVVFFSFSPQSQASAQTSAATQPINVHPASKFRAKIAPLVSFPAGNGHDGGKKISDNYRKKHKKKEERQAVHNFCLF